MLIYVGIIVVGINFNIIDVFWLVFVVKIFGCIFGVSFLVNMGLVCFFIFKRRWESILGKLMNNL